MRYLFIALLFISFGASGQAFWVSKTSDSVKTTYNTILNKGVRIPLLATSDTSKALGVDSKGNVILVIKGGGGSSIGDSLYNIYNDTLPALHTLINAKGAGTVTSITAGTGLDGGTITSTGTISMPATGTAGTYGSATQVPVITTDAQGRVTAASNTLIDTSGLVIPWSDTSFYYGVLSRTKGNAVYPQLTVSNTFSGTNNIFNNGKFSQVLWADGAVLNSHNYRNQLSWNNDNSGVLKLRDSLTGSTDGLTAQKTGGSWQTGMTQGSNAWLVDMSTGRDYVSDGTNTLGRLPTYLYWQNASRLNLIMPSYFAVTGADSMLHPGYIVSTGDTGAASSSNFGMATRAWVSAQGYSTGSGSGTVTNVIGGTNITITGTSTIQPTVNISGTIGTANGGTGATTTTSVNGTPITYGSNNSLAIGTGTVTNVIAGTNISITGTSTVQPTVNITGTIGTSNGGTGTTSTTSVNTTPITYGANNTVAAAAGTLTGSTLASGVTASSLTSVGTISSGVWQGTAIADAYISSGTNWNTAYNNRIATFTTSGSSGAATFTPGGTLNIPTYTLSGLGGLANITTSVNTVALSSGANVTVTAAAGTLTGATLASGVTASSLTSFGTSPSLTTPLLGTPTSGNLSNCTNIPAAQLTGSVTVSNGGTGLSTLPAHAMLIGNGASNVTSLAPGSTSGKIPYSNGTDFVMSTPTLPVSSSPTSGKVMIGDGTNWVASTPTYPNASATSRKTLISDGTNFVASTETWAVPSTSGNVLTSDGTNWVNTVAYATTATASTIAERDSKANGYFNNVGLGFATIVTAAGSSTLTVDSVYIHEYTGSSTHTLTLPVTSTIQNLAYTVYNNSSGNVTVKSSGATTLQVMAGSSVAVFTVRGTGHTDATDWIVSYQTNAAAAAGTVTSVTSASGDATVATTTTTPVITIVSAPKLTTARTINGTSFDGTANIAIGGTLFATQRLVSGTTYTPTSGTTSVFLVLVGGGGGGGGVQGASSKAGAGGGGGAGGICYKFITGISGTYTYAIGGGGGGGAGATPAAGTGGGNTTFTNGGTTYTAFGGSGGQPMTAQTTLQAVAGGAGGVVSTNGDQNAGGQPGGPGITVTTALGVSGNGGNTPYGAGGLGLAAGATAGNDGIGNGCGGSGGFRSTNANSNGGAGKDGIIYVYEYK